MSKTATLHLLCGKMASGKSTLSKELTKKHSAILLVEDIWLSQLYPEEIKNIQTYLQYSSLLKTIVSKHVKSLLSLGVSVVLDFPANTIEQRNWCRTIYENTNSQHQLHFVNVSDETCKLQLRKRSQLLPEGSAFTSNSEFEEITKYFQPPTDDEEFNIVLHEK